MYIYVCVCVCMCIHCTGKRWYKNVGLGFKTPKEAIEGTYIDKKCPFTGSVSIRGRILTGVVHKAKMNKTIVVRFDYLHYGTHRQRQRQRETETETERDANMIARAVSHLPNAGVTEREKETWCLSDGVFREMVEMSL